MKKHIENQIQNNKGKNLLYKNVEDIIGVDKEFLRSIMQHKENKTPLENDLVEFTVDKALSEIYQINQYIDLSEQDREELKKIYITTYDQLQKSNAESVLQEHHKKLASWLKRLYPEDFTRLLSYNQSIGSVVNSEYSADLQIQLLDLQKYEIIEPIIDLGSGPNSVLAKKLRETYGTVYCLDRELKINDEHNLKKSWFDYHFTEQTWGAVISHMGFSNHYLYTLENDHGNIKKYSEKYTEILNSLKLNGCFFYAPGIPDAESKIDRHKLEIIRTNVTGNIYASVIRRTAI